MSKPTYASSTAEGGRLGAIFSQGSGAGDYSISSQNNFTIIDPTTLNAGQNLYVPQGFIAIISAGGSLNVATSNAATGIAALLVDGAVVQEQQIISEAAGAPSCFNLGWVLVGDGKVHNITLGARTTATADHAVIENSSLLKAPYLLVELTQNNLAINPFPATPNALIFGQQTYASSYAEGGKLGAYIATGSGAGNYTSASPSFVPVDGGGGQLTLSLVIPRGFVFIVSAGGTVGSSHLAPTPVAVGLLLDGVLVTEQDVTPHSTTAFSAFGLNYVVVGDGKPHSVALAYRTNSTNVTIQNSTATNAPFIMGEITQSNVQGFQTEGSSQAEGGTLGVWFLTGTGLGNYTNNSQSFINVDATALSKTIIVPKGFVLMVTGAGVIGSATAVVPVSVGIAVDGVMKTQIDSESQAAGNLIPFVTQYMIVGDDQAHTIALMYRTNATADSVTIGNSSSTHVPSLTLELTQSNLN